MLVWGFLLIAVGLACVVILLVNIPADARHRISRLRRVVVARHADALTGSATSPVWRRVRARVKRFVIRRSLPDASKADVALFVVGLVAALVATVWAGSSVVMMLSGSSIEPISAPFMAPLAIGIITQSAISIRVKRRLDRSPPGEFHGAA